MRNFFGSGVWFNISSLKKKDRKKYIAEKYKHALQNNNYIRETILGFLNDYAAMKSSNTCTPLSNINRHYITEKVTLLNKYKLKLSLEMLILT